MTSKHLIDPELLPALDMVPGDDLSAETLPAMREAVKDMLPPMPTDDGISVEERWLSPSRGDNRVRVLIYQSRDQDQDREAPAVLDIHGGGYILGLPEMDDPGNRNLVTALGAVVVSVDYRLAPECPHPAALEDCYSALKWLHDNARELGVDPGRIAVAGVSAGGGLAAGLALLARDRGEVKLVLQILVVPMLDDRTVTRWQQDPHPWTGEFIWRPADNRFGWSSLLAGEPGGDDVSPYAAPARTDDLAGLPPAFIAAGALDLFVEEDMEYARRLLRAGVPTELHVYPGAHHGFLMAPESHIARSHTRDMLNALKRGLTLPE